MAAQMFSTAVVAGGTPQRVSKTTVPAQAALAGVLAGNISPRGTAISFQAATGNAGPISIGGPTMNAAAVTGIARQLLAGAVWDVRIDGETDIADFYFDGTTADKLLVAVIG